MKIMEFTTQALAQSCADAIDALAVQYWTDQGRTVQDGTLISWNAATLADDAAAPRTLRWATPELSPEGTWWVTSLVGTDYEPAMAGLRLAHTFTERDMPAWGVDP